MKYISLKKTAFFLLFTATALAGIAQQKVLTLGDALHGAASNYPSIKQKQLLKEVSRQNQQLLDASLFPQFDITGKASYQSEVTSFDMPGLPKGIGQKPDNYNLGLEMRFPLTQFGTVASRKQLDDAQTDLSITQVEVELQRVREHVTNLVGNAVLQNENLVILALRLNDLDSQRRKVAVGVANGAVLKSNQLILESELLATQQRVDDTKAIIKGLTDELSILTGLALDSTTQFRLSDSQLPNQQVNRPELKAFEAQRNVLDLQSALTRKETRPNVYVFGQSFYGRPGYNFLNNNFRVYATGGVGLSWNLNSLFNLSKQQKVLALNREIVSSQEATFSQNLQAALAEKSADIEKYQSIIQKDAQIVSNRAQILRASASQLANGVITSTEYLQELNAQNTAQLNLTVHKVQLSLAKAQYNTLLGY
jgi:outer membrane protein TolC